jgi:hypothetical protein
VPLAKFQEALDFVCLELAKMIVRDGEGVSKFVTINVHGAATERDAEIAARAVANSVLVKTSWCGGDPNWGRILDALGYSRARIAWGSGGHCLRRPARGAGRDADAHAAGEAEKIVAKPVFASTSICTWAGADARCTPVI